MEFYTTVDFVRPGMLGTADRFKNKFEIPIANGLLRDSTPYDVKVCFGHLMSRYNPVNVSHRCDNGNGISAVP